MGTQLWFFRSSASELAAEVRKLCFRALLKQDGKGAHVTTDASTDITIIVEYFDKDVNSVSGVISERPLSFDISTDW